MNKQIAKNGIWLSGSQIFSRIIGLVYFVFVARSLSLENFGIYTFTMAFVYNFFSVADFGIERLILRDISREPSKANDYFNKVFPLRFFLSLLSMVLFLILGLLLGQNSTQLLYFFIFGLYLIPYNLIYLIVSIENAKEKMHVMALANISAILFSVLFGAVFILLKLSLLYILSAFFWGNLIVLMLFLFNLKKFDLSLKISIDAPFWKKIVMRSWVFAALTIIAVFYLRISIVSLNLLKGSVETGLYGTAFKFIEGLLLIPQSLTLALFPMFSKLSGSDNLMKLKSLYTKCLVVLFLISLPLSLIFFVFPKQIITIPYGTRYLQASLTLPIFAIAIVLFFLNSLAGNIIQNSDKIKGYLPIFFANFLVEVILCILLIPKFGMIGAAWSVVGGEVFALIANNLFVFKLLKSEKLPAQI